MMDNPMSSDEFEFFVNELIGDIIKKVDDPKIESIGVGRKNKIQGASGYKHQIDISCKDLKRNTLVLIECKSWNDTIDIIPVLTFHARILDISKISQLKIEGIMVTTKGYSKGANKYADYYGIKLQLAKNEYEFKVFLEEMFYIGLKDKANFRERIEVYK